MGFNTSVTFLTLSFLYQLLSQQLVSSKRPHYSSPNFLFHLHHIINAHRVTLHIINHKHWWINSGFIALSINIYT